MENSFRCRPDCLSVRQQLLSEKLGDVGGGLPGTALCAIVTRTRFLKQSYSFRCFSRALNSQTWGKRETSVHTGPWAFGGGQGHQEPGDLAALPPRRAAARGPWSDVSRGEAYGPAPRSTWRFASFVFS